MNYSLKWPRFNKVSVQTTSNALWKLGEVFFNDNLTLFLLPQGDHSYSHTNSYIFAMTQDDRLAAGAWVLSSFKIRRKTAEAFCRLFTALEQDQNPKFPHALHCRKIASTTSGKYCSW